MLVFLLCFVMFLTKRRCFCGIWRFCCVFDGFRGIGGVFGAVLLRMLCFHGRLRFRVFSKKGFLV